MIYLSLFYEFFKTGLFAIGGGMATVPFLYNLADKTGWFTASELTDMIAVSESTPGSIGINMACYVGFTSAGILGSLVAALGLVAPSLIIILIIAGFLEKFRTNKYVDACFYGIRPASTGLIAASAALILGETVLNLGLIKQKSGLGEIAASISEIADFKLIALAALVFALTKIKPLKKLHPIVFIAFSAIIGIVFKLGGA